MTREIDPAAHERFGDSTLCFDVTSEQAAVLPPRLQASTGRPTSHAPSDTSSTMASSRQAQASWFSLSTPLLPRQSMWGSSRSFRTERPVAPAGPERGEPDSAAVASAAVSDTDSVDAWSQFGLRRIANNRYQLTQADTTTTCSAELFSRSRSSPNRRFLYPTYRPTHRHTPAVQVVPLVSGSASYVTPSS